MRRQLPAPDSTNPDSSDFELKRELLRVVLANTLKRNGIPPQWIGGELNSMNLPTGELRIEVRLSVEVDEPRFITYLSSFQADFERRLLAISPDARQWVSGIVWSLTPDPTFESPMPTSDYWEQVMADRELTAREKGAIPWDREALARHFVDTDPGELVVDFADTVPPDRDLEDIVPQPKR
jgi:hypothetical protein